MMLIHHVHNVKIPSWSHECHFNSCNIKAEKQKPSVQPITKPKPKFYTMLLLKKIFHMFIFHLGLRWGNFAWSIIKKKLIRCPEGSIFIHPFTATCASFRQVVKEMKTKLLSGFKGHKGLFLVSRGTSKWSSVLVPICDITKACCFFFLEVSVVVVQQLLPLPHSKKVACFIMYGMEFRCECDWLPVSTRLCNTEVLVQGLPK